MTLDPTELAAALAELPWQSDDGAIVRTVRCRDFAAAIRLIDAIAVEAERRDHHPDLAVERYRVLTIRLTSHDVGGVTRRDLGLARAIEELIAAAEHPA